MTREEVLALPAGRELDQLVTEKVMGKKLPISRPYNVGSVGPWSYGEGTFCPYYSIQIAAAWQVFTHLCLTGQMIGFTVHSPRDRPDLTEVDELGYAREWMCTCHGTPIMAPTAPLAICRAALKTVLAREDTWLDTNEACGR